MRPHWQKKKIRSGRRGIVIAGVIAGSAKTQEETAFINTINKLSGRKGLGNDACVDLVRR